MTYMKNYPKYLATIRVKKKKQKTNQQTKKK